MASLTDFSKRRVISHLTSLELDIRCTTVSTKSATAQQSMRWSSDSSSAALKLWLQRIRSSCRLKTKTWSSRRQSKTRVRTFHVSVALCLTSRTLSATLLKLQLTMTRRSSWQLLIISFTMVEHRDQMKTCRETSTRSGLWSLSGKFCQNLLLMCTRVQMIVDITQSQSS